MPFNQYLAHKPLTLKYKKFGPVNNTATLSLFYVIQYELCRYLYLKRISILVFFNLHISYPSKVTNIRCLK